MAVPYEVWSLTWWVTISFSERNDLQGVNISTSRCLWIQYTYVNTKKVYFYWQRVWDTCGLCLLNTSIKLHGLVDKCLSIWSLYNLCLLWLLDHYLLCTTALRHENSMDLHQYFSSLGMQVSNKTAVSLQDFI